METFLYLSPYIVFLLLFIAAGWVAWQRRMSKRMQALASINAGLETEIARMRAAEGDLLQSQGLLEKQVKERTLQLQEANQQLYFEKMRQQSFNQQRDRLSEMTALLQASASMGEAGQVVKSYLSSLFPGWNGALYAINAPGAVEPVSVWGNNAVKLDHLFSIKDCWALRRGKMYQVGRHLPHPTCQHVKTEAFPQVGRTLCIPLSAQGENIGMLHFVMPGCAEQAEIREEDLKFLEMAADSLALSLANLRLRESLQEQSTRDPLTELFNWRYMRDILTAQVQRALRLQIPFCVMMVEIDNFRIYNNTHGHEAGNYVIKKLADTLTATLRQTDTPCRYGGDEFILVLPDTSLEDAGCIAEKVRQAVQVMALVYEGKTLGKVTVSIGVAECPQHGQTNEAIFKAADAASYRAKAAGKNCVMLAE